jgi:hypothetical protein
MLINRLDALFIPVHQYCRHNAWTFSAQRGRFEEQNHESIAILAAALS